MMRWGFPHSMFDVAGMAIKDITDDDGMVRLTISPVTSMSACSGCGTRSGRIHSRYIGGWRTYRQAVVWLSLCCLPAGFSAMLCFAGAAYSRSDLIQRFWHLGLAGRPGWTRLSTIWVWRWEVGRLLPWPVA